MKSMMSVTSFLTTEDETSSLYETILNDISIGVLEGGQRLKVADLAKRYGVSTSPVREVLRRMQGEGFVDINPNRGAMVRKCDANTIQNIYELLELLEPYFVAWFAEFAPPELINEMESVQSEIEKIEITNLQQFRLLDAEFHWLICKRHYNQEAAETWRNLRRALNVHGARLKITPSRFETIMKEHRQLLAAMRNNDVTLSVEIIRKHAKGSYNQMSQQLKMLGI